MLLVSVTCACATKHIAAPVTQLPRTPLRHVLVRWGGAMTIIQRSAQRRTYRTLLTIHATVQAPVGRAVLSSATLDTVVVQRLACPITHTRWKCARTLMGVPGARPHAATMHSVLTSLHQEMATPVHAMLVILAPSHLTPRPLASTHPAATLILAARVEFVKTFQPATPDAKTHQTVRIRSTIGAAAARATQVSAPLMSRPHAKIPMDVLVPHAGTTQSVMMPQHRQKDILVVAQRATLALT